MLLIRARTRGLAAVSPEFRLRRARKWEENEVRVPKVGVANTNVDHLEVAFVIADLGTRCGELYPPADELLLPEPVADGGATNLGAGESQAPEPDVGSGEDRFARSREQFELIVGWLGGEDTDGLEHAALECWIESEGRELLRAVVSGSARSACRARAACAAGRRRAGCRAPVSRVRSSAAAAQRVWRGERQAAGLSPARGGEPLSG